MASKSCAATRCRWGHASRSVSTGRGSQRHSRLPLSFVGTHLRLDLGCYVIAALPLPCDAIVHCDQRANFLCGPYSAAVALMTHQVALDYQTCRHSLSLGRSSRWLAGGMCCCVAWLASCRSADSGFLYGFAQHCLCRDSTALKGRWLSVITMYRRRAAKLKKSRAHRQRWLPTNVSNAAAFMACSPV